MSIRQQKQQHPFIFVFQSDDKELRYILKRDNFDRPVCIDQDSRLDKLNKFPQDITFQTFLLDRDNKGESDPSNQCITWLSGDLYFETDDRKISPGERPDQNDGKAINSEVDFGAFSKSERKRLFLK